MVRALTEWSSTNQNGIMDQTSIAEGIGGVTMGFSNSGATPADSKAGLVNVRQNYIQGIDLSTATTPLDFVAGTGAGRLPNNYIPTGVTATAPTANISTRRYQVNFGLGLFTQDKLVNPNHNNRFQLNSWHLNLQLK